MEQDSLTRIALKSPFFEARIAAANRLTDKALLESIAVSDGNAGVREAAVKNPAFSNQVLLCSIAINDINRHVSKAALKGLYDEVLLTKVSKETGHFETRELAELRLKDLNRRFKQ